MELAEISTHSMGKEQESHLGVRYGKSRLHTGCG